MRTINKIVIHCSATRPDQDIGVDEIREWHLQRGFGDIGYHYVIRRGGIVEVGRPRWKIGAHARGHNSDSIGICLVGGIDQDGKPDANYNYSQYQQLYYLVGELMLHHENEVEVLGHRDLPGVKKACPCFNVKGFFNG